MVALVFPSDPQLNEIFPDPAMGGFQWRWDGDKWRCNSEWVEPAPGGMEDAPLDGQLYGRFQGRWEVVPPRTGPAGTAGVTSWNSRTGSVTLVASDLTGVGACLLNSPTLTGAPTTPTPGSRITSNQIINGAFMNTWYTNLTSGTHANPGQVNLTAPNSQTNIQMDMNISGGQAGGFHLSGIAGTLKDISLFQNMGSVGNNISRWQLGVQSDSSFYLLRKNGTATVLSYPLCIRISDGTNIFTQQGGVAATAGSGFTQANQYCHGHIYYASEGLRSDERIKENIAPSTINALDVLNQIKIVKFDWSPRFMD